MATNNINFTVEEKKQRQDQTQASFDLIEVYASNHMYCHVSVTSHYLRSPKTVSIHVNIAVDES